MAIPGLHIEHLDIGGVIGLNVEILTVPVVANIDDHRTRRRPPAVANQRTDCGPGSQLPELRLYEVCVHVRVDTDGDEKVRGWPVTVEKVLVALRKHGFPHLAYFQFWLLPQAIWPAP